MSHKAFYCWVLVLLFAACKGTDPGKTPEPPVGNSDHPFLIVKADQYAALRDKSDTEPWKSMKADALSKSQTGFASESSNSQNAYNLQKFVGAAALAYILDEDNATVHAHRVRDAILNDYSDLDLNESSDWGGVVPNLGSYFVAILSLDIVYNALTQSEITACESSISEQIFKLNREGSWADVRRGTHGAWDIYTGDRTEPDNEYYEGIMAQITEDGVSPVTIHYAWERVGGGNSRVSKSGYMDVLEFTGIDTRFYNNERLKKFQRWLFGSSVNTAKEMAIIGDMLPTQRVYNDMLHRRVVNFDSEAASYAAWFHEGTPAWGNILTYIIPKEALPAPQVPSSQLYTNGGAFLREKADDPNGLHAVLYNIMSQDEWHTHQEINGLALSGFGNRLLVNAGRLGSPVRAAALNNTLTIDGEEHNARIGGGITEGFTHDELDYASGAAGPALSNDQHDRNMVLVHASDGAQAYCVLFDEVQADPGEQVKNYLHPANESQVSTLAIGETYQADIDHKKTVSGAKLSFFYATPPLSVNIEKVASAVPSRYPDYPDHNRLEAVYETDLNGNVQLITVLFPHASHQSAATFSRISDPQFTGGSMLHDGGIVDYALESNGEQVLTNGTASFQARALLYREDNSAPIFYFARKGRSFSMNGIGFESDAPVSIYARGQAGVIISPGATITLRGPGMGSITFETSVSVVSSGSDFIEVVLPEGSYEFQ